ncbi:phage tail tape measure protein [Roseovarius sp. LXJ103]|uniref:phage tail tape measure protein n=1 Tax=Roseovarius carneus TaxID=2853164 RepID=UPI000D613E43|nr:phage tail tape measure protein [Roseovarius carneus]MBZ8118517.1 phage tail tape measure protein [Roseovarius carneus]PWE35788.1 phage tail protein [Pelagicola sp. LXJ1103]
MEDSDQLGALEAQIDAMDGSFGAATDMAAAFNAEMARVRGTFERTGQDVSRLDRGLSRGLRRAIKGAVVDGDSLSVALDSVATSMMNTSFNAVVKPVTDHLGGVLSSGIGSFMGGLLPFAKGGTFAQGRVQPFANGGVVSGPVAFPMRGGAGLMGEAGPEAIMPLARGPDGKLGVRGAGGGNPVNVVMNISTPDADGFRRSQGQIAAQLGRAIGRGQRNR